MALNIVAYRKVSLKGFAEGWDDCYLTVKALNAAQFQSARDLILGDASKEDKEAAAVQLVNDIVVGGTVIDTREDGTTQPVRLEPADIPYVVDMLGSGWQFEVVTVAAGTDRLKALNWLT